jgi:aconitate hydratase
MQSVFTGPVFVVGDNIDTDQIIPAQYLNLVPTIPEEYEKLGAYAFAGLPESAYAMRYVKEGQFDSDYPIVVAGRNYGCGSSRDWAAKGTKLLGVRVVIAESFERIHRSNLVGMGVLPLQFEEGTTAQTLQLDGTETYDVLGLGPALQPQQDLTLRLTRRSGAVVDLPVLCRIDTPVEIDYYRHGGILPCVLRQILAKNSDQ